MNLRKFAASSAAAVAAVVVSAAAAALGVYPAAAAAVSAVAVAGAPGPAASVAVSELKGVAATSAGNAWAVGYTGNGANARALIVRWNGTAWNRVPSPSPGRYSYLYGVAATSARNAWAVGYDSAGPADPPVERQSVEAGAEPGRQHALQRGRDVGR